SAHSRGIGVPVAGKRTICRVFCAEKIGYRAAELTSKNQRVSVIGGRDGLSDGKGVVATFFLIRYQSVVASRREINFARQFFRISLFIFAVQQDFRDSLAKSLRSKIALNSTPMTNGNTARLFGDNYRHGIRFLSNPKAGAMT